MFLRDYSAMCELALYPGIVLVFILCRSFPRMLVNRGELPLMFHDTWYHLMLTGEIRAHGHRIPDHLKGFLLSTVVTYPPLFHWLLSFLPRRTGERLEPFWGGVWDGLVAAALLAVIVHTIPAGSVSIGLFTVLLLLVTPAMLGGGCGPRAMLGTPRVFGQMLFTFSSLSFIVYITTGSPAWFVVAAVFGSLIFVSSRFSIQVFVFLNLLVASFMRSWTPIVLVFVSCIVSMLWFKGRVFSVLAGQIRILSAMELSLRRGKSDSVNIGRRNRWREILFLPRYLLTNPPKAQMLAFKHNTLLILILQMPVVPACFFLGGPSGGVAVGPLHVAGLYVWAGLALFALTSLRPLLFMGEAERYVEHVIPLLCLTLAFSIAPVPNRCGVLVQVELIGYSVCAYLYTAYRFVALVRSSLPAQAHIHETLDWIRRHASGKRFVVLPRNQMNVLIPYLTDGSVLFGHWSNQSPPDLQALRNPESEEFANCRDALFARFKIDYIVALTRARDRPGIRELFESYPQVFQNGEYTVLACRSK